MIAIKAMRLLHLLSYFLVASQVVFYLTILSDSLKAVSLENFFELRKTIDSMMTNRFKAMYYSCLALSVLTVVIAAKQPSSIFFITSVSALIFLAIDLFITVKGSLPLNSLSHSFPANNKRVDWERVRIQWLNYMKYRGIAILIGFTILFSGLLFPHD